MLFLLLIPVAMATLSRPHPLCTGGALFLSLETSQTWQQHFSYDCTDLGLENKIEKLKKSNKDPFVSYYLKTRKIRGNHDYEEGSGNYDDEDGDEEEFEQVEEITPSIVDKFEIPIEPTPVVMTKLSGMSSSHFTSQFTSSEITIATTKTMATPIFYSSSIKPDRIYVGSGDGFLATPIVQVPVAMTTMEPVRVVKMQKQILQSGVLWEEPLDHTCTEINPKLNWIALETVAGKTRLIALPSVEEVSDYEFTLYCNHTHLLTYYSIRQRQTSRNWNHLFRLEFGTVQRGLREFSGFLQEIVAMVTGSSQGGRVVKGKVVNDLVVVRVGLEEFPFWLEFVNETLVVEGGGGGCPTTPLSSILTKLTTPTSKKFSSTYTLHSVQLLPFPGHTPCDKSDLSSITTPKNTTTMTTMRNYPPAIKNQIDKISGRVGNLLVFKIPSDFCYDPEDGSRVGLGVRKLKDFQPWGDDFWMQFDERNGEVFGVPMEAGSLDAVIICRDKGNLTTYDSITINIEPHPPIKYSAEFSLHFDSIPWKPVAIRKFLTLLSTLLSPEIIIKSMHSSPNLKSSTSHVQLVWFNSSNPGNEAELNEIRKVLWSEEGGVNRFVKTYFSPDFNLSDSGGVVPVGGVLLGGSTPIEGGAGGGGLFDFGRGGAGGGVEFEESEGPGGVDVVGEDDWRVWVKGGTPYLTTYILPSILIAILLLLALIIACLLSRHKTPPQEFKPIKKPYPGGVPVIFQDELEQNLLQQNVAVARPRPPSYDGGGGGTGGGGTGGRRPPFYNYQQQPHPQQPHPLQNPPSYPDPYSMYQPPPAIGRSYNKSGGREVGGANRMMYVPP